MVGKHSGSAGVRAVLAAHGVALPADFPVEMLPAIRRCARAKKGSLNFQELDEIVEQCLSGG